MPTNRSIVDDVKVPLPLNLDPVEQKRALSLNNLGCRCTNFNSMSSYNLAHTQPQDTIDENTHPHAHSYSSLPPIPPPELPQDIRVTLSTPPNDSDYEQSLNSSSSSNSSQHALGAGQPHIQSNNLSPLSPRPSRQNLPQLAIPTPRNPRPDSTFRRQPEESSPLSSSNHNHSNHSHSSESQSDTTTPETPASLSSPIVGVVDLTKYVRTTSREPDCHGGYSDIYCGKWEREIVEEGTDSDTDVQEHDGGKSGERMRRTETVKVAIKLLRVLSSNGYDEVKARKRLNREVYVWHRLEHPNIVTFLGTSYHMSGRPALVLPWFSNGCAPEYLRRNPDVDRLQLILDVARGLHYLHTKKPPIVHGDLKGNNILITDDGRATLSDFGLAQVIEQICLPQCPEYTPSGGVGPIRWQAPEFLQDDEGHPKMPGDIWSFGCTCYELLTGNIPYHFRVRDPLVMQDIQSGIRPPGCEENSKRCGDRGIWDLMNDCWITSPENRIQITDVVSRLEDICAAKGPCADTGP